MTAINRKILSDAVRQPLFHGSFTSGQVEGLDAVLDEWEKRNLTDLRYLANMLATDYHETGTTMQAVRETLAPSDDEAIGRLDRAWAKGSMPWVKQAYWRKDGDGKSWLGRGLVQLTFKANYATLGRAIGVDLVANPAMAMDLDTAVQVMFEGMLDGLFTGKKLADYFNASRTDWEGARRIINGTDRAALIAGYARTFMAALTTATA